MLSMMEEKSMEDVHKSFISQDDTKSNSIWKKTITKHKTKKGVLNISNYTNKNKYMMYDISKM